MADSLDIFEAAGDAVFAQAVRYSRLPLTISDPNVPDNPIIFANDAFCTLTGYDRSEIVGKNCRFLQGPDTTGASIDQIRSAVAEKKVAIIEIVNYRKDGTSFINALQIGPIYDENGDLKHYFGSQNDITQLRESETSAKRMADAELRHRLLNIVNVLGVVIRQTALEPLSEEEKLRRIDERIAAVGKAHLTALVDEDSNPLNFRELSDIILTGYVPRGAENLTLEGPDVTLGNTVLTSLSLVLHELATNAVKHGALGALDGHVQLNWAIEPSENGRTALTVRWAETGGPAVNMPTRESGSKLVANVLRAAAGSLEYDWKETGLVASAKLPIF